MKLKQSVKNIIILGLFYLVIIGGILMLGWRMNQLEQQKMTDTSGTYISQNKNIKLKI